jgi:hypothetical protein
MQYNVIYHPDASRTGFTEGYLEIVEARQIPPSRSFPLWAIILLSSLGGLAVIIAIVLIVRNHIRNKRSREAFLEESRKIDLITKTKTKAKVNQSSSTIEIDD